MSNEKSGLHRVKSLTISREASMIGLGLASKASPREDALVCGGKGDTDSKPLVVFLLKTPPLNAGAWLGEKYHGSVRGLFHGLLSLPLAYAHSFLSQKGHTFFLVSILYTPPRRDVPERAEWPQQLPMSLRRARAFGAGEANGRKQGAGAIRLLPLRTECWR